VKTSFLALVLALAGCGGDGDKKQPVIFQGEERHFAALRKLTDGGQNAEAYFSKDDSSIIFQSQHGDLAADQMFTMSPAGERSVMVSNGKGRCTCGYFFPDGKRILYSSTQLGGDAPPPPPDHSHGYVWGISASYDIFTANPDGSDMKRLTETPGYDAESVITEDGSRIIFTSVRNGDLDIYSMKPDGTDVRQLTDEPGYDGGPWPSPDGKLVAYRAHHPKPGPELDEYRSLLAQALVRPTEMDLWIMDADGSHRRQLTHFAGASFGPSWHPDGKRIIFASNMDDPKGRNFDIYLINLDGSGLERITTNETFDAFPMFSHDGKHLVFASNRSGKVPHETNIFIADWKE
jgi:TolB protein